MKNEHKPELKSHAEAINLNPNRKATEKATKITENTNKRATTTEKKAPLTDQATKLLEAVEMANT